MSDRLNDFLWFSLCVLVLGCILGIPFLLSVWDSYNNFANLERSKAWTETRGVITYAGRRSAGKHSFPDVEYRYWFEGKNYFSKRIEFSDSGKINWWSNPRFEVGSKVRVFFDPNEPTESTLFRDVSAGMQAELMLALVYILLLSVPVVFAVLGLPDFLRRRAKETQSRKRAEQRAAQQLRRNRLTGFLSELAKRRAGSN